MPGSWRGYFFFFLAAFFFLAGFDFFADFDFFAGFFFAVLAFTAFFFAAFFVVAFFSKPISFLISLPPLRYSFSTSLTCRRPRPSHQSTFRSFQFAKSS